MGTDCGNATLRAKCAIAALACASWIAAADAAYVPPLPEHPEFQAIAASLVLPDGRRLLGGAIQRVFDPPRGDPPESANYSFAVARLNPDGTPDATFSGDGLVAVPMWGYYEFVDALAVQPDGRIIVAGNAADPIGRADFPACHPAICKYYPALIRLNPDGILDRSFNGNGKVMLAIGEANSGLEVAQFGTLTGIALDSEGRIVIFSKSDLGESTAVARLNADGTLDTSFVGTIHVAREIAFVEEQGLWWYGPQGAEPGAGINFSRQGGVLFGTWFNYDRNGRDGGWLAFTADRIAAGVYRGIVSRTHGPPFNAEPFDAGRVTETPVGEATVTFTDAYSARIAYTVDGVARIMALYRQVFDALPTCVFGQAEHALADNYTDLWYAAPPGAEAGWGLALGHQGDVIFANWLTYGLDGAPMWLSGTAYKVAPGVYEGILDHSTGPFGAAVPWPLWDIAEASVGSFTLTFANGAAATFRYQVTLGSPAVTVEQTKAITRQIFVGAGTRCS